MSIRTYFENIADAIKDKNPNIANVTPVEMPSAIRSIPSGSSTAGGVTYDNTASGLTANNVQDAIDELAEDVSTINSDLSEFRTWKILDQKYTGAHTFDLPSSYNELYVVIIYGSIIAPIVIPKVLIDGFGSSGSTIYGGTGPADTANTVGVRYRLNVYPTRIEYIAFWDNHTNRTSNTSISVYYR